SRESALLVNNVLLVVAAAAVLLGTLYPLFHEVLGYGKLSVGLPWFEVSFPLAMVPAVLVMGIGPLLRWKEDQPSALARRLTWAVAASVGIAVLVPVAMGGWSNWVALGIFLASWVATTSGVNFTQRVAQARASNSEPLSTVLRRLPRGYWGMMIAHLGVCVFI